MKSTIQSIDHRNKQRGAVLVISLLLLVVITTLAISGMNTATTELAMARNDQNYEYAFQAAETGLETAIGQGSFNAVANGPAQIIDVNYNDQVTTTVTYEGPTLVPDRAFSLGVGSGVAAHHFLAAAVAKSKRAPGSDTDRDSSALHTQAFYVVGPGSSSL